MFTKNPILSKFCVLFFLLSIMAFSGGINAVAKSPSQKPKSDLMSPQQTTKCLGSKSETVHNSLTGKISFVGTKPNEPIRQPIEGLRVAPPELAIREYLSNCGSLFGLSNQETQIIVKSQNRTEDGRTVFRFQQVYQGIPVFGGELVVQLNAVNDVIMINGDIVPDIKLDTHPSMDATVAQQKALQIVAERYQVSTTDLQVSTAQLWIYSPILLESRTGTASLVWRMEVTPIKLGPIHQLVLMDANLGIVILDINQVDTARNRLTYTANNSISQPGTLICNESNSTCAGGDMDAVNAHIYGGDTYDFYFNIHGRDSINNTGMALTSTVHYSTDYCNAFWNGYQMTYGDGCFIVADDVVAHEMTHGVTQYESNLIYVNQSGAINESFSDIWGEFVDLTNGKGNDNPAVRWLIGEDTSIGAIRNMKNPTTFGDPDRMTAYVPGGDVHTNSGISNKAAYLITDGDTFNGYTVTGIGITKTAKVYYEAQTNILTTSSSYYDLYYSLYQACNNLIGTTSITANDCTEVRKATEATEMNHFPPFPPATNDEFNNAISITSNPYTSSLDATNATLAPDDPILPCAGGGKGGHTVWYSYTAPGTGKLKADTHGSEYLNILSVWAGTPGNLTNVGCHYDNNSSTSTSKVYVNILAGETYYIEVAGPTNNYFGNMTLNVDFKVPTYITCADITQVPLTECNALQALYNGTNGTHWAYADWFETTTPCGWHGVYCNLGTNVRELYLVRNNLTGAIPPELSHLTQLEEIWLNDNQLSGNIPREIGSLAKLQLLSLGRNQLTGNIPPELGNLTQLYWLGLDANQLTSSIPPELGHLANLQTLFLGANQLTGGIPLELGNLTRLQTLDLRDNQLSGIIPLQVGHLSQLVLLRLNNNQLSGGIPPELGTLSQLSHLLLNDNQLTGALPDMSSMTSLKYVYLQNNKLGGEIPISIKDLSLTILQLSCGLNSTDPTVIAYLDTKVPGWRNARCVLTITADTPDPSLPGQAVNVAVTVGGGTMIPTGTVDISGADTNCQITLSGGSGNCNVIFNTTNTKTLTAIYDGNSTFSGSWTTEVHNDSQAPTVTSITRTSANPTSSTLVNFSVTFSESVTGVDTSMPFEDYVLVTSGVTGASITSVNGSDNIYTITVNTGTGNGTIRLDILDDDSIKDAARNPLGGVGTGNGNFSDGEVYDVTKSLILVSSGIQDGWILESTETSGNGGTMNSASTLLYLGDNAQKKQYRSILSFNTSSLPDNAIITKVTLKLKKQGVTGGGNPVTTFQGFMVDIKKGTFGTAPLALGDFKATASKAVGPQSPTLAAGWYSLNLTPAKAYINKLATNGGLTQMRLRFKLDDNNNAVANFLKLYSGNAGAANRPQLVIEYYVP